MRSRFGPTLAGQVWRQVSELGIINSSMQFAAAFTLGFIPFLMLLSAAFGPGLTRAIAARSGFTSQATHDLAMLFTHARTAHAALTVLALALALLGGGAVAHMLQTWYATTFRVRVRGWRATARRVEWLAGVFGFLALQAVIGRRIAPHGGDIAAASAQFLLSLAFWWWSLHTLLSGQIAWRKLFPAGLATAACYTGLGVYITYVMSSSLVASDATYGPIGTVITLLTAQIGLAVVVQLGAAIGATVERRKDGVTGMLVSNCRNCGKSIIKREQSRGPGSPDRSSWLTNDSDGDTTCYASPEGVPHQPENDADVIALD